MSKTLDIEKIINSSVADDDNKGNQVFDEICKNCFEDEETIILDFSKIELVNTAFLNNAVGRLYDKSVFDISKHKVHIKDMHKSMIELLRESLSNAYDKYACKDGGKG